MERGIGFAIIYRMSFSSIPIAGIMAVFVRLVDMDGIG